MNIRYNENILYKKFQNETWFNEINSYLIDRYVIIEKRIFDTDRYVSVDPKNEKTFSYEYGSILRDICSVFGSVMDKFVRKTSTIERERYDMGDYRKWLIVNVPDIHLISVAINLVTPMFLIPFSTLSNEDGKLSWWDAYTELKHSEIDNLVKGNLRNCVDSMSALAVLWALMSSNGQLRSMQVFSDVGIREPKSELEKLQF